LNPEVVINAASGTRVLGDQDLPLSIGTAIDCAIRIPGPVTQGAFAQIGMLDGRAFVQVAGQAEAVLNGDKVAGTSWLQDGDELAIAGALVRCSVAPGRIEFAVDLSDADYATAPPLIAADDSGGADVITPVRVRQNKTAAGPAKKTRPNIAYVGLAILVVALLYMFTAVTVVIQADADNAEITLPGSWVTPGSNGRYLLLPGTYEVRIAAPGFVPYEGEIIVQGGDRAEFSFVLDELPGRIAITTFPEASGEVWVDGEKAGDLPGDELLLAAGKYEIRLKTERFLEYVTTLEVAGRDKRQTVDAELTPGWANVTVVSEPPGAEIAELQESGATKVLGVTPAEVELLAGVRQIAIRKPGYKTAQVTVNAVAGQAEELPLVGLQEAGGMLRISSRPSAAAVTVDGEFAGNTPVGIEVAKGRSYRLTLSKAGYDSATRQVEVSGGEPIDVAVSLQAKIGKITVVAAPADATLYVDGKAVGEASQELELIATPHRLEIRKPGYETWSATVTPKPGLPQRLDVRLLTPQQATIAAVPKKLTTSQGQVMRLIEPGEFILGAPRREQGRRPNEVRRPVKLTRWFYISEHEVTNRQFREFRPRHTSGAEKYRELAADDHPAVMMSWEEAAAYCNWLSDKEGLERAYVTKGGELVLADPVTDGYRLPTEAEWAWVARFNAGGGERKYPWGDGMPPPDNAGNYADSYAVDVAGNTIGSYTDGYPVTSPIGTFAPGPLGIYDLGGNVAEWTNDRYSVTAAEGKTLVDPTGPTEGQYHVIRGSSWRHSSISELRLAYRDFGDRGRLDVGFRIARYTLDIE